MTLPRPPRSVVPLLVVTPLLLGTVACDGDPTGPGDPVPPALRDPGLSTDGWTLVERPEFRFRLPPGFEKLDLRPVDSDAAFYRKAEESTLTHDFGIYGARIAIPDGAEDVHRDVHAEIGERSAVLLAYRRDGEWVLGARWPDLGEALGSSVSLLVTGRTPDVGVRDQILAAIYSMRFR